MPEHSNLAAYLDPMHGSSRSVKQSKLQMVNKGSNHSKAMLINGAPES